MAIPHAEPAELVDVAPLGAKVKSEPTTTLIKTRALEVIRLVLPAGKVIAPHSVPGEVTVQCIEDGKLSILSDIGVAVLGCCVGDTVECRGSRGPQTHCALT